MSGTTGVGLITLADGRCSIFVNLFIRRVIIFVQPAAFFLFFFFHDMNNYKIRTNVKKIQVFCTNKQTNKINLFQKFAQELTIFLFYQVINEYFN
jgi:hypothetical protein